jgi:hypothetical protein
VQALHDDEDDRIHAVVDAALPAFDEAADGLVAIHLAFRAVQRVGIVDSQNIAALADQRREGDRDPAPHVAVGEVALARSGKDRGPEGLIPFRHHQIAGLAAIARGDVHAERRAEEALSGLGQRPPNPRVQKDRREERFRAAGRHVDDQARRHAPGRERLQMLAHGVQMPAPDQRRAGLKNWPRLPNEPGKGPASIPDGVGVFSSAPQIVIGDVAVDLIKEGPEVVGPNRQRCLQHRRHPG